MDFLKNLVLIVQIIIGSIAILIAISAITAWINMLQKSAIYYELDKSNDTIRCEVAKNKYIASMENVIELFINVFVLGGISILCWMYTGVP